MTDFATQESSRCLHCKNPQCRAHCPLNNDIPTFLEYVRNARYDQAVHTIGHLFGEVCGYICPREIQCKGGCLLNKTGSPVDIGKVERQVFAQHFPQISRQSNKLSHLKIAVVGGGVSGVTFAEQCYRHGADVTIFEKNQLLHTLRSIPSFRLPLEAVQRVVSAVENSSIKVVKCEIRHSDILQLQKSFDVVYLAVGVSQPNKMYANGEELATLADDFLRGNTFGKTVVIGGGNTAMDCARLNARNGGETIVAYRRTREDMPAFAKEILQAEQENVQFCFNLAPIAVENIHNKLVVTFAKTASEGRGKLVVTDETLTMQCDIVVVATGSKLDSSVYPEKFINVDENNRVEQNLFAGGDATGKSLAVQAVADGLNAFRALLKQYS